jgi:leucyl aminopeptidase
MALASTQLVPTLLSRSLVATAFSSSLHVQQARASSAQLDMSSSSKMDRSFVTWSFDEPCRTMSWSPMPSVALLAGTKSDNWDDEADLVFVGVFAPKKEKDKDADENDEEEGEPEDSSVTLVGGAKDLDEKLGGALSNLMLENSKAFRNGAKAGSTTPTLRVFKDGKAKRYIAVGLGTEPDADKGCEGVGSALGKALAANCDSEKKVNTAKILVPTSVASDSACASDLATAFYSSLYSDNRFRTGKKVKTPAEDLASLAIIPDGPSVGGLQYALDVGKKLATGIFMTKDIVNAPHNVLNSESLADTARRLAQESDGTLTCTILGKKECEERGMGAYLGVARASETEPQFIHMTYSPQGGVINKKIGVIGKGLLFDTGGYNIKTGMMELMKFDCGGAAAVFGAARAIGALKPPGVECHFVVAACENMINEKGMVPSDILTASNGKTIEVLNTDAEGRLTLVDALVYCDKEIGCESIIELSTLTGACMVALGKVWIPRTAVA